jgi:hypothetical protein
MMTPLGDIATIATAYPFRKKIEAEDGGDVAIVQLKDAEGTSESSPIMVRNDGSKYERYLLKQGDLLLQSRGSRHPVAVMNTHLRGIAGSGLHVIRPTESRVVPEYLAWWLNHPVSQGKLTTELAKGTYIPFLSKRDLEGFLVPLPPLDVQSHIVTVDRLRRTEREFAARLDALSQQLVDAVLFDTAIHPHIRKKDQ